MEDRKEQDNEILKSSWEAPTIEEIDYAQTEASYIPGTADAALYTN